MSQKVNKVAEPDMDFDGFCGSISLILPYRTDFAEGAHIIWQT